jgi:uncharacterized damage-inducible protein DinB
MRFRGLLCACVCLALATPAVVFGQEGGAASAQKPFTPAPIAPTDSLSALEGLLQSEVVSAADAMPADKYDFAPPATYGNFAGVRTFGQQVKHLAQANYAFFQGWGIAGWVDPKTLDSLKTKDELMKALKDSYTFLNAAIASITPDNAFMSVQGPPQWKLTHASVAAFALAHSMDHYGQMVEYLRMNGIVPPASRQQGSM